MVSRHNEGDYDKTGKRPGYVKSPDNALPKVLVDGGLAAQIIAEGALIEKRNHALSSTINFSKFSGTNPWDFEANKPRYDPETGFYPWCPYAERTANYLDTHPRSLVKPIKIVFIARDHLKTTIIADHMARAALISPNRSFAVIADTDPKASLRLKSIADVYKSEWCQEIFADRLQPNDGKARYHYTSEFINMVRARETGQPSIIAKGAQAGMAGYHFNGCVWFDDVVNEENATNPETQEKLWIKMQQIIKFMCSPECTVIISGTRYNLFDAYHYFLDKDGPLYGSIAPGKVEIGCTDEDEVGKKRSLFYFRFCQEPEEKEEAVYHKGIKFTPVRESLVEKKATTFPKSEWYAQMENNPIASENQTFKEEHFKHILPVDAHALSGWLAQTESVRNHILQLAAGAELKDTSLLDRGALEVAILGDPAYGGKTNKDYSVLLVVAQDVHDHWYLMNGFRTQQCDTRSYFTKAFRWRDEYGARYFAIETHAKESTETVAEMVAGELGVVPPLFFDLKDNSHIKKEVRIKTLEPVVSGMKLHVCQDFPRDVLDALATEAAVWDKGPHDDLIDALANGRQVFYPRRSIEATGEMYSWRNRCSPNIGRFLI